MNTIPDVVDLCFTPHRDHAKDCGQEVRYRTWRSRMQRLEADLSLHIGPAFGDDKHLPRRVRQELCNMAMHTCNNDDHEAFNLLTGLIRDERIVSEVL